MIYCGPMHLGHLLKRLISYPAMGFLTYSIQVGMWGRFNY